ncbi:MAG TPA: HD domain-containing protein, partial [Candidatus Woesebacteria bacterium]|nr:HD domain-containing protein [Candidatus Woesebacteria bacterium]
MSEGTTIQTAPQLTNLLQKLELHAAPPTIADRMAFQIDDIVQSKQDVSKEKVEATANYFTQPDARLGMTPIQKIAEMYNLLDKNTDATAIEEHTQTLIKLAFEQQLENPPQYLSHGFDHTMNVLRFTEMILNQNPQIVDKMAKKYNLTNNVARFMLLNTIYFHDVGYPAVNNRGKAVHSFLGAEIVSSENIRKLYQKLLQLPEDDTDLLNDFCKAILYHNADSKEQVFTTKIVCAGGDLLVSHTSDIPALIDELQKKQTLGGVQKIIVGNNEIKQNLAYSLKGLPN